MGTLDFRTFGPTTRGSGGRFLGGPPWPRSFGVLLCCVGMGATLVA